MPDGHRIICYVTRGPFISCHHFSLNSCSFCHISPRLWTKAGFEIDCCKTINEEVAKMQRLWWLSVQPDNRIQEWMPLIRFSLSIRKKDVNLILCTGSGTLDQSKLRKSQMSFTGKQQTWGRYTSSKQHESIKKNQREKNGTVWSEETENVSCWKRTALYFLKLDVSPNRTWMVDETETDTLIFTDTV